MHLIRILDFDRAIKNVDDIFKPIFFALVIYSCLAIIWIILHDVYTFCRRDRQLSDYYVAGIIYTEYINFDLYNLHISFSNNYTMIGPTAITGIMCALLGKYKDSPLYWFRRNVISQENRSLAE